MASLVTVTFEAPGPLLSMNVKGSYANRKNEQVWRDCAYYHYIRQFPEQGPSGRRLGPSEVFTSLPVPDRRRRDPINFAATVKRIVDGITNAGAWPDDTPEWVTQHMPHLRTTKDNLVIITIRERTDHGQEV